MRPIRIVTVFLALLIAPVGLAQATPLTLNHQGLLTDNGGVPLSGSFSLSFSLYSAPTGGVALWTEAQTVTVTNGLYQATLGNTTPLSSALFSGAQPATHLGVTVGTDPEISPRSALSSAPYSLNSASVEGFSSGPGNVNTGEFSIVGGDNNTNHSDHSAVLSGTDNLVDVTQFTDTLFDTTGLSPSGGASTARLALDLPGTGTILGGHSNTISGNHSIISQGWFNNIFAPYSIIGTGFGNNITALARFSVIAGGGINTANAWTSVISGGAYNTTSNNFRGQTISGGWWNTTDSIYSTIGGGESNTALGPFSTIGGGQGNRTRGEFSAIGGGQNNETGVVAAVGGGRFNKAFGEFTFIGGGIDNVANGFSSAIAGGVGNFASGANGAIGGGDGNFAGPGENATVPGGFRNVASAPGSFAAGSNAKAKDSCSFVWADCCPHSGGIAGGMPYYSSGPNTYNARATNGFYFLTTCDSIFDPAAGVGGGVYVPAGGSMWMTGSSRTLKKNITLVDEDDILKRVEAMPVYRWSYKTQGDEVQHIGPMAEDFYETFSLGDNERAIGTLDPAGVSLAATKALIKENNELKERLERLEKLVSNLIEQD